MIRPINSPCEHQNITLSLRWFRFHGSYIRDRDNFVRNGSKNIKYNEKLLDIYNRSSMRYVNK